MTSVARVVSVNVGRPRTVEWQGRRVTTGIWKEPVGGRVAFAGVNLTGDGQADRRVHGGRDKAVYAYAAEDRGWWGAELGRALGPGAFGENLTTEGLPLQEAVLGEVWAVGGGRLQVAQPRLPCFKLGIRMGDAGFPDRFDAAGRLGTYLRIVEAGDVGAGDAIQVLVRPDHGVTVAAVAGAYRTRRPEQAERLLDAGTDLPEGWRTWVEHQLGRAAGRGG